ncbi:hypothetical protein [Sphingobacterium pedocola]|uniref:hypothetical protein n=1 Tax=Sphingobacterium pedocola TaxID=2082722 RepID=UPI0018CB9D01|nr:hypothetical protein [Sphingobacterium pedocola]
MKQPINGQLITTSFLIKITISLNKVKNFCKNRNNTARIKQNIKNPDQAESLGRDK